MANKKILLVVKFLIIVSVVFTLIAGCNYVIVPRRYFNKYTEIINNKSKDAFFPNIRSPYVMEDTFLTRYYSGKQAETVRYYSYTFFYGNNLLLRIRTPVSIGGKRYFLSTVELSDSIKSGFFDKPENAKYNIISWTFYKAEQNRLIDYYFDYSTSSGANALTPVKIHKHNIIKLKEVLVPEYFYNLTRDSVSSSNFLAVQPEITVKPDSSKAQFIRMYNKYLVTRKRRYYPYYLDFEKYMNTKE